MKKLFVIVLLLLMVTACASTGVPYWLKSYPGASASQEQRCLARARAVYDGVPKQLDPGFARVNMGKAWEACMGS